MKTVKDAVELYKGHFPDGQCGCYDGWELVLGVTGECLVFNCFAVCTKKEFEDYAKMQKLNSINKEAVKPVYTQEMAGNGELPPVGCECLHTGFINDFENKEGFRDGDPLIIISHYDDGVIFRRKEHDSHGLVVSHTCNDKHFKPIGTRTDEEKLIDDVTLNLTTGLTVQQSKV